MGQLFKFVCSRCDYSAIISGGYDSGRISATETYCCTSCRDLQDLTVEIFEWNDWPIRTGESKQKEKINPVCEICGLPDNLIIWDNIKNPCPRCEGTLRTESGLPVVLWD